MTAFLIAALAFYLLGITISAISSSSDKFRERGYLADRMLVAGRQRAVSVLVTGTERHAIGLVDSRCARGRDRHRRLHRTAAVDAGLHLVEAMRHDDAEVVQSLVERIELPHVDGVGARAASRDMGDLAFASGAADRNSVSPASRR